MYSQARPLWLASHVCAYRRNCQLWWIQSVYVHPDHRRKGYFRQLYDHVRDVAQREKAGGLRLYADASNARAHTTVSNQHLVPESHLPASRNALLAMHFLCGLLLQWHAV